MSKYNDPATRMPVKWKVFRFVNYFQAFLTLLFLLLLVAFLVDTDEWGYLGEITLFSFGLTMMIINNFFNIHLLSKYYPDKLLPKSKERAATILLILYVFAAIAILVLSFIGLSGESDAGPLIVLSVFSFNGLLCIYILIIQAGLPLHIERNNRKTIHQLTDEIGNSPNQ